MSSFAENLKAARERRKLRQDEAATLCDLSRATWFNYEAGTSTPPLATLLLIADRLGTTAEKLLRGVKHDDDG